MIQFNLQRFIKLARWTLTVDKKYHIKSFFQNLVIFTLVFVFFTSITFTVSQQAANYLPCSITAIVAFAVTLVLGSSFMFYSMSGKHDMQRLLMLPASNLEKYLMRYASWIILLPIQLAAFFAADLIQYVFGLVVGHEQVKLVTSAVIEFCQSDMPLSYRMTFVWLFVWLHSLYAVGATFFRFRKNNWIATTLVLIVVGILLSAIAGHWQNVNMFWWNNHDYFNQLFLILVVVNFRLSYRFFCRAQVIGKFVNA
jgi:hypothetical protein